MVVSKTAAVPYPITLSLSGFIRTFLRAEERGIYDDVSTADKLHHYRINERGGRTGSLAINDALLFSSCMLVSNEAPLSLRPENHSASVGAPLMLRLAGRGDGGAPQSRKWGAAMTASDSLVTDPGSGGVLLPDRKLSGYDHPVMHDGDTFSPYRLDRRQEGILVAQRKRATQEGEYSDARSNSAMLRLSIKYEQGDAMMKSTGAPLLFAALSVGRVMTPDVAFRGNPLDRPCHVSGDSLKKRVIFKTRASRDFWCPPGRLPTEPFVIRLGNCHITAVGKIVTLTFKGTEEAALPGHPKVTGVNSGRLGITLPDTSGSSLLRLGTFHNKGQEEKVAGNNLELPFGVYAVATPKALRTKSVVPGNYEATATFELTCR